MGQVDIHRGSVFTSPLPLIVHSVNCRNSFGSGVAGQIAKLYPECKAAYHRKHKKERWKLGDIQIVKCDDGRHIANIAGQEKFGYDGKVYASLEAIREGLQKAAKACKAESWPGFATVRLGCGLGGLCWDQVPPILEEVANTYSLQIDVYEL